MIIIIFMNEYYLFSCIWKVINIYIDIWRGVVLLIMSDKVNIIYICLS